MSLFWLQSSNAEMSSSLFIKFIVIHLPYNAYSQRLPHPHKAQDKSAQASLGPEALPRQLSTVRRAWGPPLYVT